MVTAMSNLYNVLIAGQPNSGKTTVYNGLTGSNEKVGNWHGVTTISASKIAKINGKNYLITDTPGAYSLNPVTLEEREAVDKILNEKGIIVYVIEAKTLPSAIKTIINLLNSGKKIIVAVNMIKEFISSGGNINFSALKNFLNCPIIHGEFNTLKGIKKIKHAIDTYVYYKPQINQKLLEKVDNYYTFSAYKQTLLDKITLNKITAIPFFILAVAVTFYIAFGRYGIGVPLSNLLSQGFSLLNDKLTVILTNANVSKFVLNLVTNGVVGALTGVACFLPQTASLYLALAILEQSGYASRLAYLSEGLFKRGGLSGRAIFSIFMGFGCTSVSILSSGGLENISARKKSALISGLIPCSAKIPVIAYLSSFSKNPFLFTLCIYLVGVLVVLFQLFIISKKVLNKPTVPLLIELPPYRIPNPRIVLKSLLTDAKGFIIKICTVIFVISFTASLLSSVTPTLKYANTFDNSILYYIGKVFSFITIPMGVNDARLSASIIAGFFAKEGVLSSLLSVSFNGGVFTTASLFAYTIFVFLYSPCIVALYTVAVEIGKSFAIKLSILQLIEGLIISYYSYAIIKYTAITITVTLFIITVIILIKFIKRKKI